MQVSSESEASPVGPERVTGVRAVLAAALAMGVAGDLLLRSSPAGLGVLAWSLVLAAACAWLIRGVGLRMPGRRRPWLLVGIVALASCVALWDSPTLVALDGLAIMFLVLVAGARTRSGSLVYAFIGELVFQTMIAVLEALIGLLALSPSDLRPGSEADHDRADDSGTRWPWAVLRGIVIATPLVIVFGVLLADADAVFGEIAGDLFDVDLGSLPDHVVATAAWGWIAAGLLHRTFLPVGGEPSGDPAAAPGNGLPVDAAPAHGKRRVVLEAAIVLGALDLLFLLFVAVQARYFFGGHDLVQATTGMTYARYARQGFFQLVTVVALALPVLLCVDALWTRRTARDQRLFAGLAGGMVALLLVVGTSAVLRLRLYVGEYGLTEQRLYALACLAWLAAVLLWLAFTVLVRRERARFAFGALVAGLGVLALLNVANPDRIIADVNLGRALARSGGDAPASLDARYIASLSADAVPQVVSSLDHVEDDDRRRTLARELMSRWGERPSTGWRSWNLARSRAHEAVRRHRSELDRAAG